MKHLTKKHFAAHHLLLPRRCHLVTHLLQSLLVPLHCNIGSERRRRMGRNIALYSDYCSDPS
ncbi:unnamed protein product [Brassica oleracea]